jgi:hypothetical protein
MIQLLNLLKENNDSVLKNIADEVASNLYCDRFGSCVHFAEIFVEAVYKQDPNLLSQFDVIEGYVDTEIGEGIPQQHTWIELKNGDKIDPTFVQFTKYDKNAVYLKKKQRRYTGEQYYKDTLDGTWFSDRRLKYPEMWFKNK